MDLRRRPNLNQNRHNFLHLLEFQLWFKAAGHYKLGLVGFDGHEEVSQAALQQDLFVLEPPGYVELMRVQAFEVFYGQGLRVERFLLTLDGVNALELLSDVEMVSQLVHHQLLLVCVKQTLVLEPALDHFLENVKLEHEHLLGTPLSDPIHDEVSILLEQDPGDPRCDADLLHHQLSQVLVLQVQILAVVVSEV